MSMLSAILGIIVGLCFIVPLFYVQKRTVQVILLVMAVIGAVGTVKVSDYYLYPMYLGWDFERDIKKQPIFNLIAKTHPKEFNDYMDRVKRELKTKEDINKVSVYSAQLMDDIFYQHLYQAPDDPIFLYLRSTLELYRYLLEKNPALVVQFENGGSTNPRELNALWDDPTFQLLLSHVLESKMLIIENAIENPVTETKTSANPLLETVMNALSSKFGEPVMQLVLSKNMANAPPTVAALFIISLYSEISATGKENAGIIMRHIAKVKLEERNKLKTETTK